MGAKGIETDVYVLVSAVDLIDVADDACSLCRHGCDEKGDTGADVRRGHLACTELISVVMSHYYCPMWIAEDDLGSHINELVDKEEAALKHLLMDQNRTLALGRHHKDHT